MTHRIERLPLGAGTPGTRREVMLHRFGEPGARPKAYFQAAIHADEIPALLAAHHLVRRLMAAEAEGAIRGEIVVAPFANPIGLEPTRSAWTSRSTPPTWAATSWAAAATSIATGPTCSPPPPRRSRTS
jgi:predicted deacylase